jgi:hypothetical protein
MYALEWPASLTLTAFAGMTAEAAHDQVPSNAIQAWSLARRTGRSETRPTTKIPLGAQLDQVDLESQRI